MLNIAYFITFFCAFDRNSDKAVKLRFFIALMDEQTKPDKAQVSRKDWLYMMILKAMCCFWFQCS